MKLILIFSFCLQAVFVIAQQNNISQAIITTKTTIVSPDNDDLAPPPPPPSADGAEVRIVRFGGDGETISVTYLKKQLVKTVVNNEISITTTYRDNEKKITSTVMEMNGSKNGFFATDEEQEQMRKKMDSLMKSRTENNQITPSEDPVIDIIYKDDTKKIAGLLCKKAWVTITRKNRTDTNLVWYCPEIKLEGIVSTGGLAGFGMGARTTTLNGLEKLNGFPMYYEMKMARGRIMTVEVTKLDLQKEIKDKEFEIPKDADLKPIKDLEGGENGRRIIRIGH